MLVGFLIVANLVFFGLPTIGWICGMELEFIKAKFLDNEEFTSSTWSIRNLQYENPYNF